MIDPIPLDLNFNWIGQLPDDVQESVLSAMTDVTLGADQILYLANDQADDLFQVLTGEIWLTNMTAEGKEMVVYTMQPGDCFGEVGVIEGSRRAHTATAVGPTTLARLPRLAFDQLRDSYPEINREILLLQCCRIRLMTSLLADSTLRSLRQKLARRLIFMLAQFGKPQEQGIKIDKKISQETLGKILGASRQAINKELHQLQEQQIIRLERSIILVLEPEKLQALCR